MENSLYRGLAGAHLAVAGLTKVYPGRDGDVPALDNISLRVDEGEFVSIGGASGCGKSTLLRIIAPAWTTIIGVRWRCGAGR
jgi:NitT/TauT family transport system ATP-binding protein